MRPARVSWLRPIPLLPVLLALAWVTACGPSSSPTDPPSEQAGPLSAAGRWLVDGAGRVVILHGVNEVMKASPFHPAAAGFGEDDVEFLVAEGFNVLRLGIDLRGLMPTPGRIDDDYLEQLAGTVELCATHGIHVLLDFHQDGFAPKYNGNGFPDWMAIDDGLPNPPDAHFPLYYVQNPAMQRAFGHLWANDPGPDGVGLLDAVLRAFERVVTRFADEPMVIGPELINEPWPGEVWRPCVAPPDGCRDLERELLVPFYRTALASLRDIAPRQLLFVEPFVLFNFGQAPTSLPGTDPGLALAFHSYAIDVAGEEAVLRYGAEAAERDGAPALVTEFGATTDPVLANRLLKQLDDQRLSWIYWAYNEQIVPDQQRPLTEEAIAQPQIRDALVRPYPRAIAGVPTRISFDPSSKIFELDYSTRRAADGATFAKRVETVVWVPPRHYPAGYTVLASGARVTSKPCASLLRLRTEQPGQPVTIRLTPGATAGCPS